VKESRFIELLNLYIDQQIAPEDAAQLEDDILSDPRHRRTYQQYCRMHRACTVVFSGAQPDRAAEAGERADAVASFEPAFRRSVWKYYAAGLAAAASLAFVAMQVFVHPHKGSPGAGVAAVPAAHPAPVQPVRLPASASWRMDAAIAQGGFPQNASLAVNFGAVSPDRAAADSLRPSIEEFVFEQVPSTPGSASTFRSRAQIRGETEMTAFQFQR